MFSNKTIQLQNRLLFLMLFFFFAFHFSFAQEASAEEASVSHSLVLQASSLPEAKLGYIFNYRFPFLQGDNPLTEGNNVNLSLSAEVSPISLIGAASVAFTPIAFLEFSAGGRIGTGWTIELFGEKIYGLAVTQSDFRYPPSGEELYITERGGIIGKTFFGGAFQFDLAAIFPGEWNHVVFRTYHEINYARHNKIISGGFIESWMFENDDGENLNGFRYYANALIGYQMPIFLNMAAILVESDLNLYDVEFPPKKDWGGDLPQWTFSALLNFAAPKQVEIALLTQFRTRKNYLQSRWEDIYYLNLNVDRSNPLRLEFYRVAAIATYKF